MCLALLIFTTLLLTANRASCNRDANRLFEELMGRYNKLARPVKNDSDAVRIQFKLKLLQLLDVHEKNQVITSNGWLIHIWNDYRLVWRPEEYGNVTMLHIPGELIWLPDIILYNTAHGSPAVTTVTKAHVYSHGEVVWEPPVIYNSMCNMDIEWFPYDEQYCQMKFGSWTHIGSQLDMIHLATDRVQRIVTGNETEWTVEVGIDVSEFQESVEWQLMSVIGTRHKKWYPCCSYPYIDITYYINIRRKTLFYTVNLITPCVGIAFLTSFVFYLPSESNNKITLCVSVLVSLTVFFLLLVDIIPPTSIVTPLVGKYLLFTMIMVALSVSFTVIVLNVHYRTGEMAMPTWMRRVFIELLPRVLFIERRGRPGQPLVGKEGHFIRLSAANLLEGGSRRIRQLPTATITAPGDYIQKCKDQACRNVLYIARQLSERRRQENLNDDWRFVAMVMDRVLLVIFSLTIFVGSLMA
uniref:Uncharacterized protein n=1 Tax=Plectus sambesii TaxID=2011161 RepID=A0A914WQA3_9BILA